VFSRVCYSFQGVVQTPGLSQVSRLGQPVPRLCRVVSCCVNACLVRTRKVHNVGRLGAVWDVSGGNLQRQKNSAALAFPDCAPDRPAAPCWCLTIPPGDAFTISFRLFYKSNRHGSYRLAIIDHRHDLKARIIDL
jgi:hypothetical protein